MNFITFYADGRAFRSGSTTETDPDRLNDFLKQFIPVDGFLLQTDTPQNPQFCYFKDGEILPRPESTLKIKDGIVTGLPESTETPYVYVAAFGASTEQKVEINEGFDLNTLDGGYPNRNTYRFDTWPQRDYFEFNS